MADIQRKKHCDHCHLAFGLKESRYEINEMIVHKEPCLTTLQHRANLRMQHVVGIVDRTVNDNRCLS